MEILRLEQLTSLQRVTASVLGVPPTEVDVVQDREMETLTACVYGKRYIANCTGCSVKESLKGFLRQVVEKL